MAARETEYLYEKELWFPTREITGWEWSEEHQKELPVYEKVLVAVVRSRDGKVDYFNKDRDNGALFLDSCPDYTKKEEKESKKVSFL